MSFLYIGDEGFETHDINVNDVNLYVLTAGDPQGKPLICLHGFPDTPHTFIHQYPLLIKKGYRLVIPFLRGYPPSENGSHVDYFVERLFEDVLGLMDHFGFEKASLLGHDWGALASYGAAMKAPERIEKMLVAAVPPLKVFENSGGDLKQAWRSRYAFFFQLGPIATWFMKRNNLSGLDYLWSYWSPTWKYTEEDIEPLKSCLSTEDGMASATAYYRAMVYGAIRDKAFMQSMMQTIKVNTLVCAGENDGCIGIEFFENVGVAFEGDYRLAVIPGAGHFMHRENPEAFNREMLSFFEGEGEEKGS